MNGQYNQDRWNNPSEMQETPVGEAVTAVDPQDDTVQEDAVLNDNVIQIEPVNVIDESIAPFISREEAENLRTRWNEIQIKFVDEPNSAVHQADALVTEVIEKITRKFADERSSVESQWDKSVDASTEDLRKALQRFRSFFNRLVA